MNQFVRTVVITGASAGLGEALALRYADKEHNLGLIARNRGRLKSVSDRCQERGAHVEIGTPDVTERTALVQWMQHFDAKHPIDLLIVNAGVFAGHGPAFKSRGVSRAKRHDCQAGRSHRPPRFEKRVRP